MTLFIVYWFLVSVYTDDMNVLIFFIIFYTCIMFGNIKVYKVSYRTVTLISL